MAGVCHTEPSGSHKIQHNVIRSFIKNALIKLDVPASDSDCISDVLVEADLNGFDTHGIGRFHIYVDRLLSGKQSPLTEVQRCSDSPGTALLDGGVGMGQVVSTYGMKMAMDKARATGIGAVAVKNSSHFGFAGYYPLMAAKEGMVGMAFTNARPSICPTFGTEPMLGTNPIAFSAPSNIGYPFLFDAATSIVQRGAVELAERMGTDLPSGLVVDEKAEPLSNPTEILSMLLQGSAALLPLGGRGETHGGHKGYGLAIMVEILSSAFQNGPYLKQVSGVGMGHFFIAIDVSRFIPVETFSSVVGNIMRDLQNSRKEPGAERIYVPGEKEHISRQRRTAEGVPLSEELISQLDDMAKKLSIPDIRSLEKGESL